jgi:hypothetical protein
VRDNHAMTAAATRSSVDAVCAEAVDLARAAAVAVAGDRVGEHVGVEEDGDRLATHLFECRDPAYKGWRWGVQVTRAARAKAATVNDVVLLPGPDSILAPAWLPWSERLRPGDLRPGDLLPAPDDDDRLQLVIEDTESDDGFLEMGIGRVRVLSEIGRTDAAERWYAGDNGPEAPIAKQAPAHCVSCGFFVPVHGALGLAFGVCANEYAPDDGRVVSVDHGCGAHSEGFPTVIDLGPQPALHDEFTYEVVETGEPPEAEPEPAEPPEPPEPSGPPPSSVDDAVADESEETAAFGHS